MYFQTKTILVICALALTSASKVTYLEPDEIVSFTPFTSRVGFVQSDFRIYCYRGAAKALSRIFESIELQFDIADDDYKQYEGATAEEVEKHYEEQRSIFSLNIFTQKRTRLQISPFGHHCIGLDTTQAYRVKLKQLRIDFWRVIQLAIGISLFVYSGRLSHNSAFFYMAGIFIGICSSFMLVIWLAGKLVPKRPVMYGVIIGGWTVGAYMLQLLWDNLQLILVSYRVYVFWYILTTGLTSFLLCYRWGPPTNQRSKNIIKWTLQFVGFLLIHLSSYFEEGTVAIMLITLLAVYFPRSLLGKLRSFYLRRFPPKRRLLTNEEYYEQGVKETTKALDELRKFASSPDCKQWRLMAQLKDPRRFAAFVEGDSHLQDEEILHFESSQIENDMDDDDSELSENGAENLIDEEISEDENEIGGQNFNHERETPTHYLNGINKPRTYTTGYTTVNTKRYGDYLSAQQRERAGQMVNGASTSSYHRISRGRPPVRHSDSED